MHVLSTRILSALLVFAALLGPVAPSFALRQELDRNGLEEKLNGYAGMEEKLGRDEPERPHVQLPISYIPLSAIRGFDDPALAQGYEFYDGILSKPITVSDWILELEEMVRQSSEQDEAETYRAAVHSAAERLRTAVARGHVLAAPDREALHAMIEEADLILDDPRLPALIAALNTTAAGGLDSLDAALELMEAPQILTGFVLLGPAGFALPVLDQEGIQAVAVAESTELAFELLSSGVRRDGLIVVGGQPSQFAWTAGSMNEAIEKARKILKGSERVVVVTPEQLSEEIAQTLRQAGWSSEAIGDLLEQISTAIYV